MLTRKNIKQTTNKDGLDENALFNKSYAHDIITAKKATVRITTHCETRDIFNPDEVSSRGRYVGTGFFIDHNGHILTCHHVVSDSVKILINTHDEGQKSFPADIVSVYPEADLAVLLIKDYKNELCFKLGDSDCCESESDVVAIGYPLGDDTVKTTKGIVSGVKDHLIQTDTTINGGNSGGPLLNGSYEVLGVNISKRVGESVEGIGYCVPIKIFKTVFNLMMGSEGVNTKNPGNKMEKITIVYKPAMYCHFQTLEKNMSVLLTHEYSTCSKNTTMIEGYMITNIQELSPFNVCSSPPDVYDVVMEFDNKKLDCYGNIDTKTTMGKMNLSSYVFYCEHNTPIRMKFFSVKRQQIIDTNIIFKNSNDYAVSEVMFPKKINYVNIGGVVVCELTIDHVLAVLNGKVDANIINTANLYSYVLDQNRSSPVLFISKILPSSEAIDNDHIERCECAIIKKINGVNVRTVDELKMQYRNYINIDGKKYFLVCLANDGCVMLRLPE